MCDGEGCAMSAFWRTGETHYSAHHHAIVKTRATKTSSEHILAQQVYEKSIAKVYHSTDKAFLMMT